MWPWYALVAMACFATMQLLFRQLSRQGVPTASMLMLVFAFGAVLYAVHLTVVRIGPTVTPSALALIVLTAVLAYIGNLFSVRAVATAPNPGYAVAIVGLQAGVVTLVSLALFGVTLSWMKGIGVLLCVLGVALLVI